MTRSEVLYIRITVTKITFRSLFALLMDTVRVVVLLVSLEVTLATFRQYEDSELLGYFPDTHRKEPSYLFKYGVKDLYTGDIKEQWEKRDGDHVKGEYSLVEPDGSIRTVSYTANERSGFNALVKKTPPNAGHDRYRQFYHHGISTSPLLTFKPILAANMPVSLRQQIHTFLVGQRYAAPEVVPVATTDLKFSPVSKPIVQHQEEGKVYKPEMFDIIPLAPTFRYIPGMALLMKHRQMVDNSKKGPVLFPETPEESNPVTEADGTPVDQITTTSRPDNFVIINKLKFYKPSYDLSTSFAKATPFLTNSLSTLHAV